MLSLRRIGVLLVGAVAVVVVMAAPAAAHAHLLSSRPAQGGTLTPGAPVALMFDAPVDLSGSSVMLMRPDGSTVVLGSLRHERADQRDLVGDVAAGATRGAVILEWRALADDGHMTNGLVPFSLTGAASAPAPAPVPASARTEVASANVLGHALDAARMVSFLALAVLCGGLVFIAVVWPAGADDARARRLLWGSWTAGLAGGVVALGLEAAYAKGLGLAGALRGSALVDVLTTHAGRVWAADILLYLLAVPVVWALTAQGRAAATSLAWRLGAAAVVVGLLRTPGLITHSSEVRDATIGTVADLVHLLGVSVWLGGLVVLLVAVLPRRRPDELATVLPRYSTVALFSVAAIVLGGSFMSWQIIGSWHGLVATSYGHLLAAKLAVFGAVLIAARASKGWVERRLDSAVLLGGDAVAVRPLLWSVAAEVALAFVVLSLASVLVGSAPGH